VLDGPVLRLDGAAAIPVGWLPYVDSAALSRFARAAAYLHRQAGEISSIALLSQRNGRYLRLADRLDELLRDTGDTFRWTADALTPEDLITALGSGLGCAIYVGHGRAVGWVGYYGLRAHHFAEFQGRPTGAILSLCCKTASRRRVGLSFAEALPLQGVCGAVLAAVGATLHTDNVRWAVRLSDALVAGAPDVGRLVCAALPLGEKPVADYRIIGDPLSPVLSSVSGARRAREVRTFS